MSRNNYAAAKVQGLKQDLHLDEQQYQTGLSILFVGYILMQVPSNILLNYTGRPSIYLGFFVCAWGLISALTSQVTNYGSIVACRFLLGLVESPFFAGCLFYLSSWYTKKELALRMSIFYSGSLLSGAFGSLIAAGILDGLEGARGMSAWQWLYVIEGAITCTAGLSLCFFLPDFPGTWKSLPPEMKDVATKRLALDAAEADSDDRGAKSQLTGLKLAFSDPKTFVLALAYMCITGAAGFQNYFPTLTKSLMPHNTIYALLLVAPPYVLMVFYSVIHSYLSDRFQNRFWFFVYPIPISMIGYIVFMTTDSFAPRYISFFLMIFIFAQFGTIFSWISNAIPRPPAKRAAAYAFINAIGNSASIWTPYTYLENEKPHYVTAMGVNIALQGVGFLCAVFMLFHLRHLNKQQERLEDEEVQLSEKELQKLRHTAETQGVDIGAARRMQKGHRYMV